MAMYVEKKTFSPNGDLRLIDKLVELFPCLIWDGFSKRSFWFVSICIQFNSV